MLVITRYKDEKIRIGADIDITVVEVRGGMVRLGIDAPDETRIMQAELIEDNEQRGNR